MNLWREKNRSELEPENESLYGNSGDSRGTMASVYEKNKNGSKRPKKESPTKDAREIVRRKL